MSNNIFRVEHFPSELTIHPCYRRRVWCVGKANIASGEQRCSGGAEISWRNAITPRVIDLIRGFKIGGRFREDPDGAPLEGKRRDTGVTGRLHAGQTRYSVQ